MSITYKGQTYKVVATTPAGREKYLSVFKHFIYRKMEEGVIDHWQLWVNTVNEGDLKYLESMENENPKVKRYFLDEPITPTWESYNALQTYKFFKYAHDDNTIYLRFDDDIIWAADDSVEKMCKARIDNPDAYIIYPNIINSTTCNSWHQEKGVLSEKAGRVKRESDNKDDPNCAYLDAFNYSDSKLGDLIHETFKKNYNRGTLDKYYLPSRSLVDYNRFSICSVAWWGKDKIEIGHLEEPQIAWEKPKELERPNYFCGDALMVHYSYHTQRPYFTGMGDKHLKFYTKIQ